MPDAGGNASRLRLPAPELKISRAFSFGLEGSSDQRKLILAAFAAALLPGTAGAAEQAFGWVIDFSDGNLGLHGDSKIYVVPADLETEDVVEGRVAHLTYDIVNGALLVREIEITGTGGGSSD